MRQQVSLSIFLRQTVCRVPNGYNVYVIVQRLESLDGLAGPDVGVQVELLPQGQVQGPEPLTHRGHQRTL